MADILQSLTCLLLPVFYALLIGAAIVARLRYANELSQLIAYVKNGREHAQFVGIAFRIYAFFALLGILGLLVTSVLFLLARTQVADIQIGSTLKLIVFSGGLASLFSYLLYRKAMRHLAENRSS